MMVYDEDWRVRFVIATKGSQLHILKDDEDPSVRKFANKQMSK